MKLQLKLLQLKSNLPHRNSEVFFLLKDKHHPNSIPDDLDYERIDEHVLMPEVTEISFTETSFSIEMQNLE